MRRLFLLFVLLAFAANECAAQINHVSLGYGSIQFPSVEVKSPNGDILHPEDPTKGGIAHLSIGLDSMSSDIVKGGFTILIGGDSQIAFNNKQYGSGLFGGALFGELKLLKKSDNIRFRFQAGVVGIETWERKDLNKGLATPLPESQFLVARELSKVNIQAWGQIGLGLGPVEVMWSPAAKSVTVGFRLFKG